MSTAPRSSSRPGHGGARPRAVEVLVVEHSAVRSAVACEDYRRIS
jgi:hypothetical protein